MSPPRTPSGSRSSRPARRKRDEADQQITRLIVEMRRPEMGRYARHDAPSWQDFGTILGVSKQAVQHKYAAIVKAAGTRRKPR